MKYRVERTDTADSLIRKIVLYIAEKSNNSVILFICLLSYRNHCSFIIRKEIEKGKKHLLLALDY